MANLSRGCLAPLAAPQRVPQRLLVLARSGLSDVVLAGGPSRLAPDTGLTRSYWYPVDAATEPIIDERITAIDHCVSSTSETGRPGTTGFAGTVCGSRREPNVLTFMQEPTTVSSFEWTATPSWNAVQRWACTQWPGPWSSGRERIDWNSSTGKTAARGA